MGSKSVYLSGVPGSWKITSLVDGMISSRLNIEGDSLEREEANATKVPGVGDGPKIAEPETSSGIVKHKYNIAPLFQNGARMRDLRCVLHPSTLRSRCWVQNKHVSNPQ